MNTQQWNEEDDNFFNQLIFGNESTFHLSGKVDKHNVRIWGTENTRELVQYVRDRRLCRTWPEDLVQH
jgi:hypothetical protein